MGLVSRGATLTKIAIIDVNTGNSAAVQNMLNHLGYNATILCDAGSREAEQSDVVILPGVGNFNSVMQALEKHNWINFLDNLSGAQKFLGICVGYQILFSDSAEGANSKGLNIIPAKVVGLNDVRSFTSNIPNVGWFEEEKSKEKYYFTHSYGADAEQIEVSGVDFDYIQIGKSKIISRVNKGNYYGVQFHPEKSGLAGFRFFEDFLNDI
jgi:imidazole glycerol phosphate synthase glutamine amidotransferase subunit